MLFDIHSRGRRRTVQVVYIGLAVLIGAGLVLFGVGTGSSGGGLFGGLTGNNSSSSGGSGATKQVKQALAKAEHDPGSAAAWANLINARFSAANSVGYDSNANAYTAAGKQQLQGVTQAYTHYAKLESKPSVNTATIAAKAYSQLGDYSQASATYQTLLSAQPGSIVALRCVAMTSYAAGNDRVAQLAETRTLAKLPKAARAQYKAIIEEAKTTKSVVAQSC